MHNYTRDGITIAAVLDNRTKRTDGTYPVRIRVNHNRTRKYIPTEKNLIKEEWDSLASTRNRALSDIRKSIEDSFYVIKKISISYVRKAIFHFMHSIPVDNGSGSNVNQAFKSNYLNQ